MIDEKGNFKSELGHFAQPVFNRIINLIGSSLDPEFSSFKTSELRKIFLKEMEEVFQVGQRIAFDRERLIKDGLL